MELWTIEYQLVNATQEYVFEWLKDNVVEKQTFVAQGRDQLKTLYCPAMKD
jgi:uncharacterized coiled-coil protein SlyX